MNSGVQCGVLLLFNRFNFTPTPTLLGAWSVLKLLLPSSAGLKQPLSFTILLPSGHLLQGSGSGIPEVSLRFPW